MNTDYKRLGNYIQAVDVRNRDLKIDNLLGVSISKQFIKSIANTVGTDFSNYKVVKQGQFAYGPVTSRNGEKISVALLLEKECIISSSYSVFEVIDSNQLMPEYLMLWFSRPEFDRYARFKSHGSVREIFDWDEMCNVELPVPDIEKQRKIVKAYQTITDRIALKQKINDNLLHSGVSVLNFHVGTAALINIPPSEISEIQLAPEWAIKRISDFCKETKSGSTPSRIDNSYWNNGSIPWVKSGEVHDSIITSTEERVTDSALKHTSIKQLPRDTVLMAMYGVTAGEVGYLGIEATTNQAVCGMVCNSVSESAYLFFALFQSKEQASRLSNGGAQDNLSKNFIDNIQLIVPSKNVLDAMKLSSLIKQIELNTREISLLIQMQDTILAQLSSN